MMESFSMRNGMPSPNDYINSLDLSLKTFYKKIINHDKIKELIPITKVLGKS